MQRRRGFTLPEVLVAGTLMAMIAYASSTIYFSALNIYAETIWRLPPYDAATSAVERVQDELRETMLIESHADDYIVAVVPEKDANGDYAFIEGEGGYSLSLGDRVAFYLSDESGALGVSGTYLWMGVQPQGAESFTRMICLADNIHPELNPDDPDTGEPRPMFRYWPDEIRLEGVEIWITSTSTVHGQPQTQTAHGEVYLRNL
jgi:prepilin-type N-terminal cleavage/methylation domain-containing protein